MHCIEEILTLRVNAHSQLLTCQPHPLLQGGRVLMRARRIGNYDHGKLAFNHGLIDVDDAAIRLGEYLRNGRHDAWMIDARVPGSPEAVAATRASSIRFVKVAWSRKAMVRACAARTLASIFAWSGLGSSTRTTQCRAGVP